LYLDDRASIILGLIVNNTQITGKEIENKMEISRKQLSYSLSKINEFLKDNEYEIIKRAKTGKFIISGDVVAEYSSVEEKVENKVDFNEEERLSLINLILLTNVTILSTYDFTNILKISKNTLLNDFKKLKEIINKKYSLTINYDRKYGYSIIGEEYAKRLLMIEEVRNILDMVNGENKLNNVIDLRLDDIDKIKFEISKLEKELDVRYSFEFISELPYIIYFMLEVSKNAKLETVPMRFQYMFGTREYSIVKELLGKYFRLDENELIILIAIIQTQTVDQSSMLEDNELNIKLCTVVDKIIANFEQYSMVEIKHKAQLKEMLIQHCRPAFFRIKYNYHINENILDMVLPTYQNLFSVVKKSIGPFNELIGSEINDNELAYITILFGGLLKREGTAEKVQIKKVAIVVCTNGISISNYMYITFQELFPEFEFNGWYSKRRFEELDINYNLVFSTVKLETKKPLFIYKPFSNKSSQIRFRENVLQNIEGISVNNIYISEIMNIIKKYSKINDDRQLEKELDKYIHPITSLNRELPALKDAKLKLKHLVNKDTVMVQNTNIDWISAINRCAKPLLDNKSIEPRYVEKIIEDIQKDHPFIMISEGLIIAHASVESGVNEVCISIMKSKNKINIDGYLDADLLVVLGTPNYTDHLGVLNDLIAMTESIKTMKKIRESKNREEIIKIISDFKGEIKC
jgi:transcriptional antiterminator/mannitol/fructose-specific phosphotransferase system IIA component (Ntr-type)